MGKYKEVTKELIELVKQKKSGREISEILGINYVTVHKKLRKLGIHLYNYHNELKFDDTVFDIIDTEEKAYWLGFLYADGSVISYNNSVELSLKGSDIEHLKKFNTFLKNKKEVKLSKTRCNNKEFTRCRVIVTSKHFHEQLINLGCIPNKSLVLTFPDKSIFQSEDLLIPFIRGYVDGDGCLSYTKSGRLVLGIIGTKEFLQGICNILDKDKIIRTKDKRHPNSNTYQISWSSNNADKIAAILYKNANIYLQRKYDRFAVLYRNV